MQTNQTWGLLLLNLGTPDSPETPDVRRYLDEFLSDPRVLDIAPLVRKILLKAVILPRRPKESGAAYRKVWTERGSPLLWHTDDLTAKVRNALGPGVKVEYAMRYQNPSISSVLDRFRSAGVDRIAVFPLFPQYSSAANGSAIEKVMVEAGAQWNIPSMHFVEEFYAHPAFIRAFTEVARPVLDDFRPDHVLLSYHGLPERHVEKSDDLAGAHCLKKPSCCDTICYANRFCYRAQCFATTRALATSLALPDDTYTVSFQSRLGRDPWIKPYTDEVVEALAKSGTKRLAVMCPAFVADCLETIEEIGMEARESFIEAGGEDLILVPSLNSSDVWADAVVEIAREHVPPAWYGPARGNPDLETDEVAAE